MHMTAYTLCQPLALDFQICGKLPGVLPILMHPSLA